MIYRTFISALAVASVTLFTPTLSTAAWPDKPIEFVMPTGPGSGASDEARVFSSQISKPGFLGSPIKMTYKPGGSANNAVQYVGKKPADGNQILFIGGSFAGLFNLPHFDFKYDHFDIIVQFVTNIYALAVPTSSPFKKF